MDYLDEMTEILRQAQRQYDSAKDNYDEAERDLFNTPCASSKRRFREAEARLEKAQEQYDDIRQEQSAQLAQEQKWERIR